MKRIPLTQGKFALVDDEDYKKIKCYNYFLTKTKHCRTFYAARNVYENGKNRHTIRLHRDILNLKIGDGKKIDHINHNGLDCRKQNLRVCTESENQCNRTIISKSRTGLRGICLRGNKFFEINIMLFQKNIYGGTWKNLKEAVKYRNCMARILHGRFCALLKLPSSL